MQQLVMVGDTVSQVLTYTATLTIASELPRANGFYTYGYYNGTYYPPALGSIADQVGGTAKFIITNDDAADFSSPTTGILLSVTGWENVTHTKVTIDGVTRYDGGHPYAGTPGWWAWYGEDVFGLRNKNGQTLSVSIEGTVP